MPPPPLPSLSEAAAELTQRLMPTRDVIATTHFRQRCQLRNVSLQDALKVLHEGKVTAVTWDEEHQQVKLRVEGTDIEGDKLTVVIAFGEGREILLITPL